MTLEGGLFWRVAQTGGAWRSDGMGPARLDRAALRERLGDALDVTDLHTFCDAIESGAGEALAARRDRDEQQRARRTHH